MKGYTAAVVATGFLIAAVGSASAQDAAKGDATKGKSVFNQCMACHALDHAVVGPQLGGVIGRKAGSEAGYSYSPLMKAAGDAGLVWNEAEIVDYLKNPTEYLKTYVTGKGKTATGSSKMVFMLANENQRKNVVAYLVTAK
jgi:cytochrome c